MPHWREMLEALPDAVAVVDRRQEIVFANRLLHDLAGYPPGALGGSALDALVPEDRRADHRRSVSAFACHPAVRPMGIGRRTELQRADGTVVPVEISLSPLPIGEGWVVAMIRDARDRARTEAELFHRATHDPLTGLANRAMLDDRLAQAWHRWRRGGTGVTALFVDLDRFKRVNDLDGHQAGDVVLQAVATALTRTCRPSDTVARVGGDEFVVVAEDLDADGAACLAERVVAAVGAAVRSCGPGAAAAVGVSVGVATSVPGETPEGLLRRADTAMYAAKQQGGDRSATAGAGEDVGPGTR